MGGRDLLTITMQNMIRTTMGGFITIEERTLIVHIINANPGNLMIMAGDTKRNHLCMLLEAKKTMTAEGKEEATKGILDATVILIAFTTIMNKHYLQISMTVSTIVTTIVTVRVATEIQEVSEKRGAGGHL